MVSLYTHTYRENPENTVRTVSRYQNGMEWMGFNQGTGQLTGEEQADLNGAEGT
jgi:hypothetical protein